MVITEQQIKNAENFKKLLKIFSLRDEDYERICQYVDDPRLILNDTSKRLLDKYDDKVVDWRIPVPFTEVLPPTPPKELYVVQALLTDLLYETNNKKIKELIDTVDVSIKSIQTMKFYVFGQERKVFRFLKSQIPYMVDEIIKKNSGEDFDEVSTYYFKPFLNIMISYCGEMDGQITSSLRDASLKVVDEAGDIVVDEKNRERMSTVMGQVFRKVADIIGAKVIMLNDKYNAYVSFNFCDWMLASTGEDWSSCISLDSNMCYGFGLSGLFACPDWGMVEVVRKGESGSKEVLGIKVPGIVSRSWLICDEKDDYKLVGWYPHEMRGSAETSFTLLGGDMNVSKVKEPSMGKSVYKPAIARNNTVPYIYADCWRAEKVKGDENKGKIHIAINGEKSGLPYLSITENGEISSDRNGYGIYTRTVEQIQHSFDSLRRMAEREKTIEDLSDCDNCEDDEVCCDICGDYHDEEDMTYIEGHGYVCESCLDEHFFYCEECEEYHHNSEMVEVDGNYICSSCVQRLRNDKEIFKCFKCGEYHYKDNIHRVLKQNDRFSFFCDDCFNELGFSTCESCGSEFEVGKDGITDKCPRCIAKEKENIEEEKSSEIGEVNEASQPNVSDSLGE